VRTVSLDQVGREELALPPRVQEALGELVGSAKEGLLALSVGVGLGVLAELLEEEVVDVVGPKGKHIPERAAVRHGHESGEVTLGGRRVQVERPRVRTADGRAEVRLRTYEYFADRDPLARSVLERMLAGVSTRRYRRTQEPVGQEVEQQARSTSRSSVSRAFVERTRRSLGELMSRRLDDVRLAVMMIDGIDLGERTNVVALGSRPRASRSRSGSGKEARRTRPWRRRCSPTCSTAVSTPSRASSSSSTGRRRCARRSARSLATRRCSGACGTRSAT
jgi:hypothetical protein